MIVGRHSMSLSTSRLNSHDSVSTFGISNGKWKTVESRGEPLCGVEALLQRALASN